jgi:AcrR family transcriptional regulator
MASLHDIETAQPGGSPDTPLPERLILKYALDRFSRDGYAATNVRAIAADAGFSAPMVNYYFKTKEALFRAVVSLAMDDLTRRVEAAFAAHRAFPDRAAALIAAHLDFAERHRTAVLLLIGIGHGPPSGRPELDLVALHGRVSTCFERMVDDGIADRTLRLAPDVTPAAALALYVAIKDGVVLTMVKTGRRADDGECRSMIRILLHGIAEPGAA